MAYAMRHTMFSSYHPAVVFAYFAAVIVFAFAVLQPVYVCLALFGACAYYILLKGPRMFLLSCRLYLPMLVVVSLINPLFNHIGQTTLFELAGSPITWEALCYGLCSGTMLVAVLVWFSCYAEVMTSDKFLFLFAPVIPSISLVMAMIMRFVPNLVLRGRAIADSQAALLGAVPTSSGEKLSQGVRMASILASLGMEDSIETADSMNARGYGIARRTHYARYRWAVHDTAACLVLAGLVAVNAFLASGALSQFTFYPAMPQLVFWWGYGVYLVMVAMPLLVELRSMWE